MIGGGVLALVLLVGAIAYAADYGVEATITEKGQDSDGYYVVATTHIGGIDVKRHLSYTEWLGVQEGYFVIHHINSGTVEVYTSEGGTLVWSG